MYSLYRAWFGDGVVGENYPRFQEALSPPDTVVRVGNEGEHQFVAHKGVLAAHSGYLKALLASASSSSNFGSCNNMPGTSAAESANIAGQSSREPVTSVSVSSIGGEAFAPLLNYMYTGRLEVTLDNVYSVLLATHLLHMPGALEQCRAALLRLRAPPPLPTPLPVPPSAPTSTATSISSSATGSGNILRPIPNRLMVGPSMCWPPTPLYPPTAPAPTSVGIPHLPQLQPSILMQSTVSPNISAISSTSIHEPQSSHYSANENISPKPSPSHIPRNRGSRVRSRSRTPESVSSASLPFVAAAAAAFTAFAATNTGTLARVPSPSQSVSPTPSSTSQPPSPLRRNKKVSSNSQQRNKEECEVEEANLTGNQSQQRRSSTSEETSARRESNLETSSNTGSDRGRSSRRRARGSNSGSDNSSNNVLSVVYDVACCDGPVRFHRVLNENYSSATALCGTAPVSQTRLQISCLETESVSSENDENGGPGSTGRGSCEPIESSIDTGTGNYTCGYCRHTFKSQYCYRKHAKRHLLPTRINDSTSSKRQDSTRGKKEVRLLDLNVQYYPCKICGCKFPSYYFVHKHRKLCHANMEERSGSDATNSTAVQDQESMASTVHEIP